MFKLGVTFLFIFLPIIQCNSQNILGENHAKAFEISDHQSKSWITSCGLSGFTLSEAEHIINEIEKPFYVKEIKGNIINVTGDGWTKEIRVLLEIRGTKDGHITKTYADEKGNFVMKHVPDGEYCFKATVTGWQSVMGVIIVSRKADPKNAIVLEMRLGV